MRKNVLVVLGNGFDLSMGYKTRFSDFLTFNKERKNIGLPVSFNLWFNIIDLIGPELEYWADVELIIKKFLSLKPSENLNLINLTLLSYCMYQMDLDNSYYEISDLHKFVQDSSFLRTYEGYDEFLKFTFKLKQCYGSLYEVIIEKLNLYSIFKKDFTFNSSGKNFLKVLENNTNLYFHLQNELKIFERMFQDYLLREIDSKDYSIKSYERLNELLWINSEFNLDKFNSITIFNFNYTEVLSEFFESNHNIKERNIHGYLHSFANAFNEDNISIKPSLIFGIDSLGVSTSSPLYSFTKSFRVLHNNIDKNFVKDISIKKETDYIVFYGHSLDKQDYSYFQSLFDTLDLYNSTVKLVFFYSDYYIDAQIINSKIIEKSRYTNLVANLIEEYGKSFEQEKIRGQNLFHKLLLENRIEIILNNPRKKIYL